MALSISTISTAVAAMSVSGVQIKTVAQIPDQTQGRASEMPILYPDPYNYVGGSNGEPGDGPTTFGSSTGRSWICNRVFNYVYLHASTGTGRSIADHYPNMVANADAIQTAFFQLDIPGVDVMRVNIGTMSGNLKDPAGSTYFGFLVAVTFREWINA